MDAYRSYYPDQFLEETSDLLNLDPSQLADDDDLGAPAFANSSPPPAVTPYGLEAYFAATPGAASAPTDFVDGNLPSYASGANGSFSGSAGGNTAPPPAWADPSSDPPRPQPPAAQSTPLDANLPAMGYLTPELLQMLLPVGQPLQSEDPASDSGLYPPGSPDGRQSNQRGIMSAADFEASQASRSAADDGIIYLNGDNNPPAPTPVWPRTSSGGSAISSTLPSADLASGYWPQSPDNTIPAQPASQGLPTPSAPPPSPPAENGYASAVGNLPLSDTYPPDWPTENMNDQETSFATDFPSRSFPANQSSDDLTNLLHERMRALAQRNNAGTQQSPPMPGGTPPSVTPPSAQNRFPTSASPSAQNAAQPPSGGFHPLNDARIVGRTIGGGLGATVQGFDQLDPVAPLARLPAGQLAQFEASLSSAQAALEAQRKYPTTYHFTGGDLTAFGSSPRHLSNFVETVPGDPFLDSILQNRALVQRAQAMQDTLWDPRVWQQTLTPSRLAQSYQTNPALEQTREAAAARIAGNIGNVTLQGIAGGAVGLPYLPAATMYFQAGAEARNEAETNYRQEHPEAGDAEVQAVGDQAEAHARKIAAASGLLFAGMGKAAGAAGRELLPSAMGAVPRAFATTGIHAAGNVAASALVRGGDALAQGRSTVEAIRAALTGGGWAGVAADAAFAAPRLFGSYNRFRQPEGTPSDAAGGPNGEPKDQDAGPISAPEALVTGMRKMRLKALANSLRASFNIPQNASMQSLGGAAFPVKATLSPSFSRSPRPAPLRRQNATPQDPVASIPSPPPPNRLPKNTEPVARPASPLPPTVWSPAGTPIVNSVTLKLTNLDEAEVRAALEAQAMVHGDGPLQPKDVNHVVRVQPDGNVSDGTYYPGDHIGILQGVRGARFHFLHESGHWIDNEGILHNPTFEYASHDSDSLAKPVMDAITASDTVSELRKQPPSPFRDNYLLKQHELWSRAYAQFIALESQDPELIDWLDAVRSGQTEYEPNSQWSPGDFRPIAKEFRTLFKRLGWMVERSRVK